MRAAKSNLVAGAREQKSPLRKRAKKFACAHTQHTGGNSSYSASCFILVSGTRGAIPETRSPLPGDIARKNSAIKASRRWRSSPIWASRRESSLKRESIQHNLTHPGQARSPKQPLSHYTRGCVLQRAPAPHGHYLASEWVNGSAAVSIWDVSAAISANCSVPQITSWPFEN